MAAYGYARVSTEGQTLAAQEAALYEAGAAKVFKEKISGAANHRAQLHRLLKTIDAGDVVIVTRLDRLARSTRDLLNILDKIAKAGATFKSLGDAVAGLTRKLRDGPDHRFFAATPACVPLYVSSARPFLQDSSRWRFAPRQSQRQYRSSQPPEPTPDSAPAMSRANGLRPTRPLSRPGKPQRGSRDSTRPRVPKSWHCWKRSSRGKTDLSPQTAELLGPDKKRKSA
jgi:hypothetical protein